MSNARSLLTWITLAAATSFAAGCATELDGDAQVETAEDALFGIDFKELREMKEKKRAELEAKAAEELANPTRRVKISKLWNAEGPKPEDVVQNMSNCYFAAASAALAHARPDLLQAAIQARFQVVDGVTTSTLDGYNVNMYKRAGRLRNEARVDEVIQVENTLPLDASGKLLYGRGASGTFWFPVVERAFANHEGGYDEIGAYGLPGKALSNITGLKVFNRLVSVRKADKEWERIVSSENEKQPLVSCTFHSTPLDGMSDKHCNAIVGYEEKDGKRYVKLYNSRRTLFLPTNNERVQENTSLTHPRIFRLARTA